VQLFLQLLANGVANGAAYVLIALGFALIYNATREFHIAHAGSFTAAGYAGHVLHGRGLGLAGALAAALLAAGAYGWLVDRLVYAPLRRLRATPLQIFVVSLGVLTVFSALVEIAFGPDDRSWGAGAAPVSLGGVVLPAPFAILIVLTALIVAGVHVLMARSVRGYELRAVSANTELARGTGIRVPAVFGFAYLVGSATVAPAAVMIGLDAGTNPYRGLHLTLLGIVATLIGGTGSYAGAILTALAMALVESLGLLVSSSEWTRVMLYALFLGILMVRPHGLLGAAVRGKGGRA
jgi:branched-subunit amino acid ABC-type transport system permease component